MTTQVIEDHKPRSSRRKQPYSDGWVAALKVKAKEIIRRVKAGMVAVAPPKPAPQTYEAVALSWIKRHVEAKGLRSRDDTEWRLRKYILPFWGDRPFTDI